MPPARILLKIIFGGFAMNGPYQVCSECGFIKTEPEIDRLDAAMSWLIRLSVFFAIITIAGAVGFLQGALYVVQEESARFDCVAKP